MTKPDSTVDRKTGYLRSYAPDPGDSPRWQP